MGGEIRHRTHGSQSQAFSITSNCDDGTSGLLFINYKLRILPAAS